MRTINNDKFIRVIADEGYVLTTDMEGEVTNYFSEGALPLSFNLSNIREIPIEDIIE